MIKSFLLKIYTTGLFCLTNDEVLLWLKGKSMICKRKVNPHFPILSSTLVVIGKFISSEELMGPIFCALLLLSPSDS